MAERFESAVGPLFSSCSKASAFLVLTDLFIVILAPNIGPNVRFLLNCGRYVVAVFHEILET